jgi:hypothetical protein
MVRRASGAAVAVLCGLLLIASTPAAAPTGRSAALTGLASVDDAEAAGFARERGIPLEEARKRLSWQAVTPDLADVLARDLGNRSGGVWIDVHDGDRVKVGVVGGPDSKTTEIVRRAADAVGLVADGYELVAVRHPLATIEADNDWLGAEIARVNDGAVATLTAGLRPDLNAVELQTPRQGSLTNAQQALVVTAQDRLGDKLVVGTYEGHLQARSCNYPYCTKPLRGGVRIWATDIGACTGGFIAQSKVDDKLYMFTAGHCGAASGLDKNWTTKLYGSNGANYVIGEVWHWVWGGTGDMAIVRINNPGWWTPEPWVVVTDGPDTTANGAYHISSDKTSVLGMRICTTGGSYGRSDCGFVTQLGMTATYVSGVTVHNLGRGSFCGTGGDSGAPMYALHTAHGIQVGGFSECDSAYQGIKAAETKMNVNVLHS